MHTGECQSCWHLNSMLKGSTLPFRNTHLGAGYSNSAQLSSSGTHNAKLHGPSCAVSAVACHEQPTLDN